MDLVASRPGVMPGSPIRVFLGSVLMQALMAGAMGDATRAARGIDVGGSS